MNKTTTKTMLVAVTGALVVAAGARCLLLLGDVFELQDGAHDTINYLLRSCRTARMLGAWSFLLGVALCVALPSFWFAATRLGSAWRIYHLSSLTLGAGVLAFYWVAPMIYRVG